MGYIAITGASAGIGAAAAVALTELGYSVVAVGRTPSKLAAVHARMKLAAPPGCEVPEPLRADLSGLDEVRRVADVLSHSYRPLDALINNAGIEPRRRSTSIDGIELTLAVNHLAGFHLTRLLAGDLLADEARVVTTSSDTHLEAELDLADLQLESGWTAERAYANSKLANILFIAQLRRQTGLPASTFHPGSVATDLGRDARFPRLQRIYERLAYDKPEQGADTLVWLATSEEGKAPRALYYEQRAPGELSQTASDLELAGGLWEASVRLTS